MNSSHIRLTAAFACLLISSWLLAAGVTETVLPNGLTVLVKEVHAAPVVTVDAWYKVGSRNEPMGATGMSHLLEHMTYRGTKEFNDQDMKKLVKRNGAIDNGATYYDYTHYYTTIASDRVDIPLRIEASRMSSALIRQDDLNSEMTVVRSELEGRENSPGSLLFNDVMSTAFQVHPYRWPVVGWRADVEHVTADTLRHYYKQHYMPNNATLVIVGDVDTTHVLDMVTRDFGKLHAGVVPPSWVTPEPPQRGERRVTVHRAGSVPMEYLAWHVPGINHADIPALMLLDQVLGTGRTSRVYQQVVEAKLGVSAWTSTLVLHDAGVFFAGGVAAPDGALAPIEKALLAEVERIKTESPTETEMARARRQLQASLIFARDSVTDQAEQLGTYATVAGDWRYPEKMMERVKAVTPEDISRVASKYLTEDNRTVGIFTPVATGGNATAVTPIARPAGYRDAGPAAEAMRGAGYRPKSAGFQSFTGAARSAEKEKSTPRRARLVLPNGVVLLVQENHANPTVAIRASLKAGRAYDPAGKTGTADLVADLLDRGTTTRSSARIAEELEGAAAELEASTGWETTGVNGKALSGDTELLIRNLADLLRNATFPDKEIGKAREQMLAQVAMKRDEPMEIARRNFYRAVLPEGHPYRLPSIDEESAGLKAITREDLLAFYHARYTPQSLELAVVGDVSVDDVSVLVGKYFGDWAGTPSAALTYPTPGPHPGGRVVANIPDKSEVDIYAGFAGALKRTDPHYYAAEVMNMILGGGGALNSRLGDVIREQHGLAYSLYSGFHASTNAGPWYAVLGVNPANVDKALVLLQAEIARMRDHGVTAQEVQDAVAYQTGTYAIELETNAAIAGELADAEYFHLGLDYPERINGLYRAVTREQVNAAAREYLHPDQLTISIAGPYGDTPNTAAK